MRIDPAVRYSVVDPSIAVDDGRLELRWPQRESRLLSRASEHDAFKRTARRAGAPTKMPKRLRAAARSQPKVLLAVAPGVLARSPLNRDARLVLDGDVADLAGRVSAAVDRLQDADAPSSLLVLSAIEHWRCCGDDTQIVEATAGVGNIDDSTALLLIERGCAMSRLGDEGAALDQWSQVLAVGRTPAVIKRRATLARAQFHHCHGRIRRALQDLARLDADIDGLPSTMRSLRRSGR